MDIFVIILLVTNETNDNTHNLIINKQMLNNILICSVFDDHSCWFLPNVYRNDGTFEKKYQSI